MVVNVDFSLVGAYMNARMNERLVGTSFQANSTQQAPSAQATDELAAGTPPWKAAEETQSDDDILSTAFASLKSGNFISASDKRTALEAKDDSTKLFIAYEALESLQTIATAVEKGLLKESYYELAEKRLNEGIAEISEFIGSSDFDSVTMLASAKLDKTTSEVTIARASYEYTTDITHSGAKDDPVTAWAGISGFSITVDRVNQSDTLNIDLSSLADNERTLENVTDLINQQLESVGASSKFYPQQIGEKNEYGVYAGDDWGMKIKGLQGEHLSFTANTSAPALFMVGGSGAAGDDNTLSAQISKWTGLSEASPTRTKTNLFLAESTVTQEAKDEDEIDLTEHNDSQFIATKAGPDGSIYALANVENDVNGQKILSDNDLALVKYDSTGKELWTRIVGNSAEITGTDLAVAPDGRVAIAGSTTDEFDSTAFGGGTDGFVIMYNADGLETSVYQEATRFEDKITSLAFDSAGALYIGGSTTGNIDGNGNAGGVDAYVEKLDVLGNRMWINQFGSAEDDTVTAITIADDGTPIVATRNGEETTIQSVTGASFSASDWSHDIGKASVTTMDFDSDALYLGGSTRYPTRTANEFGGTASTDYDAFAIKLNVTDGGGSTTVTEDWYQGFGGSGEQGISEVIAHDGALYLSGTAGNSFGSQSIDADEKHAIIASLDASTGAENWVNSLTGRGSQANSAGMTLSSTGSSDLDAFGLPNGKLTMGGTSYVSDHSAARVGDHFTLIVDGKETKIELEREDTYRALTFKLNAALGQDGTALARRSSTGAQALSIRPAEETIIELVPGDKGSDLLNALGLTAGFLYDEPSLLDEDKSSDAPPLISLDLESAVTLTSAASAKFDVDEDGKLTEKEKPVTDVLKMFDVALASIRTAYRHAIDDPTLKIDTSTNANSTQASAYQLAQQANLQAGLDRLTGGGGGGTLGLFA
ncbi:autotransporter outer membrane beta-barrel domain-containing protein [Hirschia maritima]|uniref:PQQ-like beta-propeller repeat protein n=1 Tax=Hirschia maritima TaxID=1121961 RepID=UPI0003A53FC3|nr:PQQ-like beta-propeller repeat protein [Hirschia maritima]